jgi:hypothetical protein
LVFRIQLIYGFVGKNAVQLEKIVGASLGIVILVGIFLLPFSSAISVLAGSQNTLYAIFHFFLDNLGSILNVNNFSLELIAYLYLLGTILLLLSGILGTFVLVSGVLGISGMTMFSLSGVVSPQYTPTAVVYGVGFYLLWALCVIQIAQIIVIRFRKVGS